MLFQSPLGQFELLTALLEACATNSMKGLRARGGFEINLAWANGKFQLARIASMFGGNCMVRQSGKSQFLQFKLGEFIELSIRR